MRDVIGTLGRDDTMVFFRVPDATPISEVLEIILRDILMKILFVAKVYFGLFNGRDKYCDRSTWKNCGNSMQFVRDLTQK